MKIARINIYLIASGKLHPVIVEVLTDEGVSGIGEAAIAVAAGKTLSHHPPTTFSPEQQGS